jgi:hypothetical protein
MIREFPGQVLGSQKASQASRTGAKMKRVVLFALLRSVVLRARGS